MQYLENEKILLITAKEFVRTARRGIATSLPFDEDELAGAPVSKKASEDAYYDFVNDGLHFRLTLSPCEYDENSVKIATRCGGDPKKPPKSLVEQLRGEGFASALILCNKYNTWLNCFNEFFTRSINI